jgi:hypothetical protein
MAPFASGEPGDRSPAIPGAQKNADQQRQPALPLLNLLRIPSFASGASLHLEERDFDTPRTDDLQPRGSLSSLPTSPSGGRNKTKSRAARAAAWSRSNSLKDAKASTGERRLPRQRGVALGRL